MLTRVRKWLATIDGDVPVALLHGRARFNPEWQALRDQSRFRGVSDDDFGMPDPYGFDSFGDEPEDACCSAEGRAAAEWFLGRKRGLLSPVAIGTVDQLLFAATRTRHVMLRHAGLIGRVVILDEVHAHDVYMSQFLGEALRWLGEAEVPVILLSATLPPAQREQLVRAYAQGSTGNAKIAVDLPDDRGYPRTTGVTGVKGAQSQVTTKASDPRGLRSTPGWKSCRSVTSLTQPISAGPWSTLCETVDVSWSYATRWIGLRPSTALSRTLSEWMPRCCMPGSRRQHGRSGPRDWSTAWGQRWHALSAS